MKTPRLQTYTYPQGRLVPTRSIIKPLWIACSALALLLPAAISGADVAWDDPANISNDELSFLAAGPELGNVNGVLAEQENIKFDTSTAEGGQEVYHLYADGSSKQQNAFFVLKWDFSKLGRLVTGVKIPTNRLYFQAEPGSLVTSAKAVISYSTDGTNWTELDVFETTETTADVSTCTMQNHELQVTLDKPASTFFYRVAFSVEGAPFYGATFQWERMSEDFPFLRPNFFQVVFLLKPKS
ncbi:MAG: hypothetical protein ACOYM3_23125 [Terrimicrobiaceae bacterium]